LLFVSSISFNIYASKMMAYRFGQLKK